MGDLQGHCNRAGSRRGKLIETDCGALKYLALVCLLIGASPLVAADDDVDRIEFVVGNIVFVMLHELAHVVIEDFDIPVLGNSEDAADSLAAVALIRRDRERPEKDFRFVRMLLTAADANRILWQRGLEKDHPAAYLARHPLSAQRAARIACLAYGSDPELLEPLPEIVGLPAFRADWCDEEFADADKAWLWVKDSFIGESPGTASEHEFSYEPIRDARHEAVHEWLVENRVLEKTLEYVRQSLFLPDAITVRARSCGSPDAYWDGNTRELVLCYQLVDAFYQLSAEQGVKDLEKKIRTFHRDIHEASDNEP